MEHICRWPTMQNYGTLMSVTNNKIIYYPDKDLLYDFKHNLGILLHMLHLLM
jgi:hypothetical protein